MTPRVSATEQLRAEIDELFDEADGQRGLGDTLEEVARLDTRLLLQTALEAEVTEFLCRNRYERRKRTSDARAGSRNGYGEVTIKTTLLNSRPLGARMSITPLQLAGSPIRPKGDKSPPQLSLSGSVDCRAHRGDRLENCYRRP